MPRGDGRLRPPLGVVATVGAGGALGTVARYLIATGASAGRGGFPWSIFGVNVAGAFVLGVVMTLVIERWPPTRYVRPFAAIGFCGGFFTTFSTWMLDSVLLARDGRVGWAAADVLATLAAGLAAVYAGIFVARARSPRQG